MNRIFFSNKEQCKYKCKYCFAQWSDYKFQNSYDINQLKKDEINIVYPSCDGEFNFNKYDAKELYKIVKSSNEKIVISISTKGKIEETHLEEISEINKELVRGKRGFIKISVTITNSSLIDKLELFASSYKERINTLSFIEKHGIPSSVVIKPILPFIDFDEYKNIIDDVSAYTKLILLGDLYVDKNSDFYKEFIFQKYNVVKRKVEWLQQKPIWGVIETLYLKDKLEKYIKDKNMICFDSDMKLIEHIYSNLIGVE